jgi:hypothetical protein
VYSTHLVHGSTVTQSQDVTFLLQTHPNGISLELKTVDNQVVTVRMQEPFQEPLSGLVEFYGTVQGKNIVSSDFYLSFPHEFTNSFG